MKITNKTAGLAPKLILILSLVSILLMIVTPILFVDKGINGVIAVWGWNGIFGNENAKGLSFAFNWEIYISCLVLFVIGSTTFLIGPKARGYYIFSAIILVVLAVMFFTTKIWIEKSTNFTGSLNVNLGVGPWFAGLATSLSAIGCLYEFKTVKLR